MYLVRGFDTRPSKIGHFKTSELIFEAISKLDLTENDFHI